jgi:hypothetical protein
VESRPPQILFQFNDTALGIAPFLKNNPNPSWSMESILIRPDMLGEGELLYNLKK